MISFCPILLGNYESCSTVAIAIQFVFSAHSTSFDVCAFVSIVVAEHSTNSVVK